MPCLPTHLIISEMVSVTDTEIPLCLWSIIQFFSSASRYGCSAIHWWKKCWFFCTLV